MKKINLKIFDSIQLYWTFLQNLLYLKIYMIYLIVYTLRFKIRANVKLKKY